MSQAFSFSDKGTPQSGENCLCFVHVGFKPRVVSTFAREGLLIVSHNLIQQTKLS